MARVPADFHIHIDNDITKERVIKILKAAEENGLKAICLLEHNNINLYRRGSVLEELFIEGIEKYYTGKIITGVELNCTINNAPVSAKTGIDYNGYDTHILLYGFNPKDIKRKVDWFNEDVDAVRYYSDVDTLLSKLSKLNLPLPPKSYFRYSEGVKPFKQLYRYIMQSPEKEKYTAVLGDYPHASSFVRHLAYDPHSIIYFNRAQSPLITDVVNVGKESSKLICVAYPYHINRKVIKDPADYIDTLQKIPTKTPSKNFNAVEGPYMLNTDEETNALITYAQANGLLYTAGSDYQPQDKMYYLPPDATEKAYYAPAPGLYVRQLFDGGKGLLYIEEEMLNIIPDVRDYNIFRVGYEKAETTTQTPEVVDIASIDTAIENKSVVQTGPTVEVAPVAEEPAPAVVETLVEETPIVEDIVSTPVVEDVVETAEEVAPAPIVEETEPVIEEVVEQVSPVVEETPAIEDITDDSDDDTAVQTPVAEEVVEVVELPIIEDIEEVEETPAEEEIVEAPVIEDITEEIEAPAEEVVEVETIEESEPVVEVEEVVEKPTPKPAAKKPATKAPAKKPAAKKPAEKKAPAKKKEEPVDALDDTLALLEQLTNDVE